MTGWGGGHDSFPCKESQLLQDRSPSFKYQPLLSPRAVKGQVSPCETFSSPSLKASHCFVWKEERLPVPATLARVEGVKGGVWLSSQGFAFCITVHIPQNVAQQVSAG